MQAGSSGRGRDFAARWAEVVFTPAARQARHAEILSRCEDAPGTRGAASGGLFDPANHRRGAGRDGSIAREKAEYLRSLVNVEFSVAEISNATGNNLAGQTIDKPLDELELQEGCRGMLDVILQGAQANTLSCARQGGAMATHA